MTDKDDGMMKQTPRLFPVTLAILLFAVAASVSAEAQNPPATIGLLLYDSTASPGYTLFAPIGSHTSYLIDMWGRVVNVWTSTYRPALSVYLRENGHLLRTCGSGEGGGAGVGIQEFNWDGTLYWEYEYSSPDYTPHHDIEPLPNGNVLILAWENKTQAEAYAAGRDPALLGWPVLSPEHIVEVQRTGLTTGTIVWEWHLWDHLVQDYDSTLANYGVVAEHPELIDVNFGSTGQDWIHANSIAYNPDLDQIVISARTFCEAWVIDHSTTTAEAAGHTGGNSGMGGDILYRWGNPIAYDAGTVSDQRLFRQHDARWVPAGYPGAGNITAFNNGGGRPGDEYSSVDEFTTTVDGNGDYPQPAPGVAHEPADPIWVYADEPPYDWTSGGISGAHRLPNGNTIICSGQYGLLFEVTPDSEVVWTYYNPIRFDVAVSQGTSPPADVVFRCERYAPDYPGLAGLDLSADTALETYPITIAGTQHVPDFPTPHDSVVVTATITSNNVITATEVYANFGSGFVATPMFDDGNHHDGAASDGLYGAVLSPVAGETTIPYYIHAEDNVGSQVNDPPNPPSTVYWFAVCCPVPQIYINELMGINDACCQDENGDFDPWIELYNYEDIDIDVSSMYLTNNLADSTLFPLPDTIIAAGSHLLLWADAETGQGPTHTNFALLPSSGVVGLYSSDALRRILIDSVTYEAPPADESYGRVADGAPAWTDFTTPTPDAENSDCACLNQGDIEPDGFVTALDLASCIDILFAGSPDVHDPGCPSPRFDIDCDNFSTAIDLSKLIDHLFAGGAGPCDPCAP